MSDTCSCWSLKTSVSAQSTPPHDARLYYQAAVCMDLLQHTSRASAAAAFELSNQSEMNYARVSFPAPPPSVPFPIWSRAAAGRLHFFFMQRKPFDELHFFLSHFFREKTKHILSLFSSFGRWNNNNACIVHMQLILGETS